RAESFEMLPFRAMGPVHPRLARIRCRVGVSSCVRKAGWSSRQFQTLAVHFACSSPGTQIQRNPRLLVTPKSGFHSRPARMEAEYPVAFEEPGIRPAVNGRIASA